LYVVVGGGDLGNNVDGIVDLGNDGDQVVGNNVDGVVNVHNVGIDRGVFLDNLVGVGDDIGSSGVVDDD